jgi:outer membrane protein insertion porin family
MKYIIILFTLFTSFIGFSQNPKDSLSTSGIIGGGFTFEYGKPQRFTIGPIRIEGADNFDHNAIKLIAGLRQGDEIDIPSDRISKAIKNLWNEGLFSSVEIKADKEVAGVLYLVIQLQPRPKLSRYKFKGVTRRDADKLREEIELQSGKTITENLIFTTKNKIKGYYREKGFYNVDVKINRIQDTLINNSELFLIDVNTGNKVKIKEIDFEGNTTVPAWKLRAAMKDTKRRGLLRLFKRSKFNMSAYETDKEAALNKLRGTGLRDVYYSVDSVYQIDDKNLGIQFKVEEGNKYLFGNITWIGNTKYTSGYLDTVLGIKYGDEYNKPLFDQRLNQSQDGRDISSLYMNRGYLFFNIYAVETGVTENHINYEIRIIEGKEARVKNIIIKGNYKTNENVIRREIRTKPGDLFNRDDIIRTQRELAQLGYFNEQAFQVNPIPNPQDGTVDIEYIVEEKSADQIELSGGYGGGRIIGTLGLTFSNFSTKNIFKKDSWSPLPTGDGQRLSIRGQSNGRYYQSLNLSFTEPWLGGKKPNSLTGYFSASSFASPTSGGTFLKKSDSLFSGVGILNAGVSLGRRKKVPDDFFTVSYDIGYTRYNVKNSSFFPSMSNGTSNDISLRYNLQRNSISSPIYPNEGSRLNFSFKGTLPYFLLGGRKDWDGVALEETYKWLEYYKFKLTGEYYIPLTRDKKLVLSPRFGFALMGSYNKSRPLTPFDRFVLGGSGLSGVNQFGGREIIAQRGYSDGELSSTGGDPMLAKYTVELRYPISLNPQATFFVMAWGEASNTYTTYKNFNPFNVKRAAGVGVRIFLPMFGMLGLDYGWGFDPLDPHSSGYRKTDDYMRVNKGYFGNFSFSIGMNLGEL